MPCGIKVSASYVRLNKTLYHCLIYNFLINAYSYLNIKVN